MEVTQAELSSHIYNKTFDLEELKQIVAPIAEKYGLKPFIFLARRRAVTPNLTAIMIFI